MHELLDSRIYTEKGAEMKKVQRIERICLYREAEDEIHALLHYCFCLTVYITISHFIYAVLEDTTRRTCFLLHSI